MSEVHIIQPEHEVLVPLNRIEAERLDKRVRLMAGTARENFEKVGKLLDEAKRGQVHEVLGFKSWTAYVADALGGTLQLSGEARQAMSVRAISAATGVSKSTVDRDIAQVSDIGTTDSQDGPDSTVPQRDSSPDSDEKVSVGLDGKTRRKPRKPRAKKEPTSKSEPKPVKERRPQIRSVFRANINEMDRLYQETHRLGLDPRWKATTLAAKDVQKLDLVITGLKQLRHLASQKSAPQGEQPADDNIVEATA